MKLHAHAALSLSQRRRLWGLAARRGLEQAGEAHGVVLT
jgi:hypothetical protein